MLESGMFADLVGGFYLDCQYFRPNFFFPFTLLFLLLIFIFVGEGGREEGEWLFSGFDSGTISLCCVLRIGLVFKHAERFSCFVRRILICFLRGVYGCDGAHQSWFVS